MKLDEVMRLFGKSRRTIMRWIADEKLPEPKDYFPMLWNRNEMRAAHRRMREEQANERKQRNAGRRAASAPRRR
jgi:hypothetical protein